jgi:raffinose/stachyose/melibiose transport system substrate-binding protein
MKGQKVIVLLCSLLLAGAGNAAWAGGKVEQGGTAATQGKVTFSFWHLDTTEPDRSFWKDLADQYMQQHPNVTIQITVLENEAFKTKLATLMQSGDPPDLFRSWGGGVMIEYAKAGLLRDITSYVKGTAWGASMSPGVEAVYQYNGRQYGMPYDMGAVTFWYNKDMLSKAGYSSFPATDSDFRALMPKLKSTGVIPISLAEGDKWPGMFYWAYLAMRVGGKDPFNKVLAGTGKFTDPTFVQAGDDLLQLVKLSPFQQGYLGAVQRDGAALVGNGKAAMELQGQWAPGLEQASSTSGKGIGDKLGTARFPALEGGKGAVTDVLGGGNGYSLGKNAPDAAVDFLKFITNLKNNTAMAATGTIVPTVIGADAGLKDPLLKDVKKFVDQAGYFQLYLDQFFAPAVGSAINDAVQRIFAGTATPAQAAASIQTVLEQNQ